jgi:hypothetical protein
MTFEAEDFGIDFRINVLAVRNVPGPLFRRLVLPGLSGE